MAREKLTIRIVEASTTDTRDIFLWDEDVRGFGLKVTPGGGKTYILQYRMGGRESATRRFTIGKHGSPWTPELARKEAKRLLSLVDKGEDPAQHERRRREDAVNLAFDKYADLFVERYAKAHQTRSWRKTKRILERDLQPRFKGRTLTDLSRRDIANALEEMAGKTPALAKYAHSVLRKMYRWAVSRGDIAMSPMSDMPPPAIIMARDRVLTDVELRAVWQACDQVEDPFAPLIRLLIATGQRISEVSNADWSEFDRDKALWTIPASRAKNGLAHLVPLNTSALAILDALGAKAKPSGFVFTTTGKTPVSGFSRAKTRLDKFALEHLQKEVAEAGGDPNKVSLPPWRYHDIRRTVATGLQRLGTRLEVTEAVLNHISGSRSGIVGVYQRHNWAEEKRAALEIWARHLRELTAGIEIGGNVVPFRLA